MVALMMSLKQLSWIYCTCLVLATLAVVNAQEALQPKPDKLQVLNENTKGNTTYPDPDPKTRKDLLRNSLRINPDQNTAYKRLSLSEGNREITYTDTDQPYPDHPDRFDYPQVLCNESVSGRSYWEVEWSGFGVLISVAYQSISRKGGGPECLFGGNDQSWSLFCAPDSYAFWHNTTQTDLPVKPLSSGDNRVGVYVDHSAGTLSFYSVSGDSMILIHSIQTRFTQPLSPGFAVGPESSVKLC
ncbi:tripartite motif-containing protein 16-like [Pseudorasbora parva]|uniref:tripartite motif-containing protein 16-like n=1 Tax=Pseudorasbora parva TaxID=51549 RepID=UPI00351EA438